jgi:hypothetical protein
MKINAKKNMKKKDEKKVSTPSGGAFLQEKQKQQSICKKYHCHSVDECDFCRHQKNIFPLFCAIFHNFQIFDIFGISGMLGISFGSLRGEIVGICGILLVQRVRKMAK